MCGDDKLVLVGLKYDGFLIFSFDISMFLDSFKFLWLSLFHVVGSDVHDGVEADGTVRLCALSKSKGSYMIRTVPEY